MTINYQDEDIFSELMEKNSVYFGFFENRKNGIEVEQASIEENAGRFCCIVVDEDSQNPYNLPHIADLQESKRGDSLAIAVTAVLEIVFSDWNPLSLFVTTEEYELDGNHTIEAIHRTLQRKKERLGRLPPTLLVHLDGSVPKNKNRFVLAYLQSLVNLGVFKRVHVSFSSTNEAFTEMEQVFSTISAHLKINDAITFPEFLEELETCFIRRVTASEIDGIINYSELCNVTGCVRDVDSFSQYSNFCFVQKERVSSNGLFSSMCGVKKNRHDAWVSFPTKKGEGFLRFVPNIEDTPSTRTKDLVNEKKIAEFLHSVAGHVKDDGKMCLIRELQEKVFMVREEPLHWDYDCCLELHGDYTGHCSLDGRE